MLGSENETGKPSILGDSNPLISIKIGGVEYRWVSAASTPFGISEGVGAKVKEEGHISELPLDLRSGGDGKNGKRRGVLIGEEEEEEMGWSNRERRENRGNDEIELRGEKGLGILQWLKKLMV